ncbi:zinc finger BED domain-containing protein RICESLEEPER 1-like protein [Cinnamomum micranthum f. kanehirae]|uniref:Zinc finger BED domain-containing protein RICESLEEPER 1-like protein n=1 Tax=Cinnamomum micranthum f. kanehirae TaxID=337451 RepID=A0A3S4P1B0_9MAGN|nr:zinc finger BED domain-containing protein RICESLEEPER 1-like protein [Cinnamomum micranthum f. kanehirae]
MARSTPNLFNNGYLGNAGSCSGSTSDDCEAIGAANITSRNIMFERRRGFEKFLKETSLTQQIKSDLEMYLDEAVHAMKTGLDKNFDILAWWKFSAPKYPIVAQMARDILGIPVSSTTSEAVFDIGGRVLDKYRSSMPSSTLQSLICAQDWLKNELQAESSNGHSNFCTLNTAVYMDGDDEESNSVGR